jgi:hypothetical protein
LALFTSLAIGENQGAGRCLPPPHPLGGAFSQLWSISAGRSRGAMPPLVNGISQRLVRRRKGQGWVKYWSSMTVGWMDEGGSLCLICTRRYLVGSSTCAVAVTFSENLDCTFQLDPPERPHPAKVHSWFPERAGLPRVSIAACVYCCVCLLPRVSIAAWKNANSNTAASPALGGSTNSCSQSTALEPSLLPQRKAPPRHWEAVSKGHRVT